MVLVLVGLAIVGLVVIGLFQYSTRSARKDKMNDLLSPQPTPQFEREGSATQREMLPGRSIVESADREEELREDARYHELMIKKFKMVEKYTSEGRSLEDCERDSQELQDELDVLSLRRKARTEKRLALVPPADPTRSLTRELEEARKRAAVREAETALHQKELDEIKKRIGVTHLVGAGDPEPAFIPTDKYLADDGRTGIAIDRNNRRFALLTTQSKVIVDYSQIVHSEVSIDKTVVIKTDTAGQVGRAVVGGVLAGGIGALIGGMGASKTQLENIQSVELRVVVAGASVATHVVVLFQKNDFGSATAAINDAKKWHDLLAVAVHETAGSKQPTPTSVTQSVSIADELAKLSNLKQQGLLTEDEFLRVKTGLIG